MVKEFVIGAYFPAGPVVKTVLPLPGVRAPSLVRELKLLHAAQCSQKRKREELMIIKRMFLC